MGDTTTAPAPMPQPSQQTGGVPQGMLQSALTQKQFLEPLQSANSWTGLIPVVGMGIKINKERQINKVTNYLHLLDSAQEMAHEQATAQANGDPQKAQELEKNLFLSHPITKEILMDPKAVKLLEKAYSVDWFGEEKGNAPNEALKRFIQYKKARGISKALQFLHLRQQEMQIKPGQEQNFEQAVAERLPQVSAVSPETQARAGIEQQQQQLVAQEREQQYQLQRDQIHQTGQLRLEQMRMREQQFQQMMQLHQLTAQQTKEWHDESLAERREFHADMLSMRKQMAQNSGNPADWMWALQMGTPFSQVPAKDKAAVLDYAKQNNVPIPRQLNQQENKTLNGALETSMNIGTWLADLQNTPEFQGSDGKPSNQALSLLWPTIKYKFGKATPESRLISDMSRERWLAIAPLLQGIRRGDIIKDIVKHTPDPAKDSPQLMIIKLQALQNSFKIAHDAILWGHGFRIDPQTGQPLQPPPPPGQLPSNAPAPPPGFVVDKQ